MKTGSAGKVDAVRVRSAEAGDAGCVFALLGQFAMSYRPLRAVFDQSYPRLLEGPASDGAELLVAEVDGDVVGYALAFRLLTLYANGPIVELHELMVEPTFRGRGIGGHLVHAVIDRARATDAVEITVPTRRARDYYLRLGFEETASYLKRKLTAPI